MQTKVRELYNKNKRRIELLAIIFSSLLAIVTLVFSIITYLKTLTKLDQYTQIVDNLRQPYFISFELSNTACKDNTVPLFYVPWEGTVQGCDCTDTTNLDIESIVYKGYCSIQMTGCKSLQPFFTDGNYVIAKNDLKADVTICAKRANNFHQFHKIIGDQKGTCSSTQKLCGNANKIETVICVNSSEPCPVYSFLIATSVQSQLVEPNWGYLQINQNLHFYYDKQGANSNALPMSQIVTTSGPGPCKFYSYKQTKFGDEYILQKWTRTSCETDTEFIKSTLSLTEDAMYQLNMDNNIYQTFSSFPGINLKNSKEIYTTYYKPYIPWEMSKRNEVFGVVDILLNIDEFASIMYSAIYVNAISVVFIAIYLNAHYIYYVLILKLDYEHPKILEFKVCKLISSFILKCISMGIAIAAFVKSINYRNQLNEVCQSKPTLDVYIQEFQVLADFTNSEIFRGNLITIVSTVVNMIIDIVSAISMVLEYRNKKKGSNQVIPIKQEAISVDEEDKKEIEMYNKFKKEQLLKKKLEEEEEEKKQKKNKQKDNYQNSPQQYPIIGNKMPLHKSKNNLENNILEEEFDEQRFGNKVNGNKNQSPQIRAVNNSNFNTNHSPQLDYQNANSNKNIFRESPHLLSNSTQQNNISSNNIYPKQVNHFSDQKAPIILNNKGLVFENGMLRTKKEYLLNE